MTALLDTALRTRRRSSSRRSQGDGRSHDRRERFEADSAVRLERAARRVLRCYGYGSAWAPTLYQADVERAETEGEGVPDALQIARRGKREEAAVRDENGKIILRAFKRWSSVNGGRWVAIPATHTDRIGLAALSRVERPLDSLLVAFSIESATEWLKVEAFFAATATSPHWQVALRDAMARIMFGSRAAGIEARSLELRVKTRTFRELTRNYERGLRDRLTVAASIYLEALNELERNHGTYLRLPPTGGSQGNGVRSATWWDKHADAASKSITPPSLPSASTLRKPANG
ncbi:hypothetical protein [Lysobacter sp. GCM10012299]|uniref:hypothetical protein n=1 Tax=Lysobacter sp. GCM10012299 TaxID=3317333 RepID=UPI0036226873